MDNNTTDNPRPNRDNLYNTKTNLQIVLRLRPKRHHQFSFENPKRHWSFSQIIWDSHDEHIKREKWRRNEAGDVLGSGEESAFKMCFRLLWGRGGFVRFLGREDLHHNGIPWPHSLWISVLVVLRFTEMSVWGPSLQTDSLWPCITNKLPGVFIVVLQHK